MIKGIVRKTKLFDGSRLENDAEHSWSVCLMATLLVEYANFEVDIGKVVRMLLIHDIVEIDAGDVYLYAAERKDAAAKEEAAAERIFGLLESDQAREYRALWEEFEAKVTKESKFAAVFDRLEPVLQNYRNRGAAWKEHGITKAMVIEKNKHIEEGSKELWAFVRELLDECEGKGYFGG